MQGLKIIRDLQPFISVVKRPDGKEAVLLLEESDITVRRMRNGTCGTLDRSGTTFETSAARVALRLHDQTRALVAKTHFVDCIVEKTQRATAYLVHRASSFVPTPATSAPERVAWSLKEVYATANSDAFPSFAFVSHGSVMFKVRI